MKLFAFQKHFKLANFKTAFKEGILSKQILKSFQKLLLKSIFKTKTKKLKRLKISFYFPVEIKEKKSYSLKLTRLGLLLHVDKAVKTEHISTFFKNLKGSKINIYPYVNTEC